MNAAPTADRWILPALAIAVGITVLRLLAQYWNSTDLFVDETQYWFWGQNLAFGYYSKPPMIGWVIRAVTDLAGSDSPFWVRFAGPVFHGITAMLLAAVAAALVSPRAAIFTAATYLTLPIVAVGSFLISTDTIMFPFLVGAFWAYVVGLRRNTWPLFAMSGALLGLAFLSKYAAVYYLVCGGLAAVLWAQARPSLRNAAVLLAAFALLISPNVLWNLLNGAPTVQHTLDNADWGRSADAQRGLNVTGLAEFLAAQIAVLGPVLAVGYVYMVALVLRARAPVWTGVLVVFSVPVLLIVCGQALISQAYANWAAVAYLTGTVAVAAWLSRQRLWLVLVSFLINGAVSLALPLMGVWADRAVLPNGQPILSRYMGIEAYSHQILRAVQARGGDMLVAENRDILADLFYTGRDSGVRFFAVPTRGRPKHHYQMSYAWDAQHAEGRSTVLLLLSGRAQPGCPAQKIETITPQGRYGWTKPVTLYEVPVDCWQKETERQ